ncbi:hypothetical protein OSJ77_16375 [Phyllobacterium sp. 0TCS1.6C]|uniref:hypothetical protein n=1 Tax=unclassified Phyllobacterium TaxID=2638441 RepID=UPI002264EF5D|nr:MULTISPECIES: hypothetical protein [unclassified Phyllobacterium]MCX8281771.1 hypothetical protein [Phyllobacterium sp. 0TCS1.6C]MCX8295306.1 hypothetical protein [Phyllobacterium sp. 0TCS1.6A]
MTWNYRILRHENGDLALHEVYYDEKGQPKAYTEQPISFFSDAEGGPEEIVGSLERALRDAKERSVLDVSDFPGG